MLSKTIPQQANKSGKLQFLKEDADKLSIEDQSVELDISRRGPSPEKEVFCKDLFYDENYNSSGDLKEFLHQVPIFDNFSKSDYSSIDDYCEKYEKHKIKLERHRVVLLARKAS